MARWPKFWAPQRGSIAFRLFVSATFWSLVILLGAGIALSALYRRTAEADFDNRLDVYMHALIADVATADDPSTAMPTHLGEPLFEISLSGWYWQITRLDGDHGDIRTSRSLFTSHLPRLADQGVAEGAGSVREGYVIGPDARVLRLVERAIDVGAQGKYLVQVAATTGDMEDNIDKFQLALAATFLALALALIGTSALQVHYGLEPLRRLQEGVGDIRRGGREHIEGAFPVDIAPLAAELNLLIDANRAIVERARTQVGNLAHALKTPLSVIANESDDDPAQFAAKVREQAHLMRDQVTFYLDRARVAARAGAFGRATDVLPVIDSLLRTFPKIYAGRRLRLVNPSDLAPKFAGEQQDLEEIFGNLIDNACKWAADEVVVSLSQTSDGAARRLIQVDIDDDGPGLPENLRSAALARGRRLDESKPGSGLGLSIVVELAELYHGTLSLATSPQGGLRATLRLPIID
ncbi:MAG: sensor histidine kinase [Hyphomicrobiales bacterium]|nr:sensor histidine kinase [Hyphomicrobiales bacterium]